MGVKISNFVYKYIFEKSKTTMRFFLFAICLAVASTLCAKTIVRPSNLQPGDKIAIISPASYPDSTFITSAVDVLTSWGYVPVVGKYAGVRHGSFAGTIANRISDIKWAFEDKDIKAILCSRGGYGAIQSLCQFPKGYFAKHPKWLIGYSDITAIHSAMVTDGVMSIHGHMAEYLADYKGTDKLSGYLKEILRGDKLKYTISSNSPYNKLGVAEGTLFGGNLSLITSVAGTRIDYLPKGKNVILFLEDVGERMESVDRMIYRLKMSGIFSQIKGLIVGSFRGCTPTSDYKSVEELFNSVVQEYNIPVVYNFPVGHVDANYPLIEGSTVKLTVGPQKTLLEME